MDEFLRAQMRARGWTVAQLADACDVSIGLATKWISPTPRYRVTPSPASCEKIAEALGLDPDQVLELAGHRKRRTQSARPPISVQQRNLDAEYDRWMEIMGPRMGREAAHDAYWDPLVADAKARRELLERALYAGPGSAVNAVDNTQNPSVNPAPSRTTDADKPWLSDARELIAA